MSSLLYISNQEFIGADHRKEPLPKGEYAHCTFRNCNFANGDLSNVQLEECVFEECDLSLASLAHTSLKDVRFKNCKLLGLRFDVCNTKRKHQGIERMTPASLYQKAA